MMLLQTLVQLNILIFATPALAGWTMLPLTAHADFMQAAGVLAQSRALEAAATPKSEIETASRPVLQLPAACVRLITPGASIPSRSSVTYDSLTSALFQAHNTFSHSTRAP